MCLHLVRHFYNNIWMRQVSDITVCTPALCLFLSAVQCSLARNWLLMVGHEHDEITY